MDIDTATIVNFLAISEARIDLKARGLVAIEGINKDDPSASSNGSAKSSIVDAVCWCLYGTTARGVSGDDVVNETVGKDTCVGLIVSAGITRWWITRHRLHSFYKNQLSVWTETGIGLPRMNMTLGTEKETQALITQILGSSYEVFVASVYAGQENMPDLPAMTDKALKVLVEEAAGTTVLNEAYTIALSRLTHASKDSVNARYQMKNAGEVAAKAKDHLDSQEAFYATFESERVHKSRVVMAKAVPETDERAKVVARRATYSVLDIKDNIVRVEEEILKVKPMTDKRDDMTKFYGFLSDKGRDAKGAASRQLVITEAARREAHDIRKRVGMPCATCEKPYCEEDLEGIQKILDAKVVVEEGKLKRAYEVEEEARITREKAANELKAFELTIPDVVKLHKELAEYTRALSEAAGLDAAIEALGRGIMTIKSAARRYLVEANPHLATLSLAKSALSTAEAAMAMCLEVCDKANLSEDIYRSVVNLYGPAGVRAHMLDNATPLLNDRTKEYLGTLSDGNIHAIWTTLSATAKGAVREKFSIDVTNDKGGKSFKLNSGGEKRKVRLATAMALQDLKASRATSPINLFMADEIDDALDEPGLERLMGLLEQKAKTCGTVLIISHRSLSDWCDNVITVTKEGGLATVSGACTVGTT